MWLQRAILNNSLKMSLFSTLSFKNWPFWPKSPGIEVRWVSYAEHRISRHEILLLMLTKGHLNQWSDCSSYSVYACNHFRLLKRSILCGVVSCRRSDHGRSRRCLGSARWNYSGSFIEIRLLHRQTVGLGLHRGHEVHGVLWIKLVGAMVMVLPLGRVYWVEERN